MFDAVLYTKYNSFGKNVSSCGIFWVFSVFSFFQPCNLFPIFDFVLV